MKNSKSEQKLRELILHITWRLSNDSKCGLVKINKILAFSDFLYYANYGKSITGEEYVKKPRGPMPKNFKKIKEDMESKKEVITQPIPVISFNVEKLIPTRKPDYSLFDAEEIAFVDRIIESLKDHYGKQLSDFSHAYLVGWQNVEMDETIPYETIFFPAHVDLTQEDKLYSAELMKRYGWDKQFGWTT